MNGEVGRYGGWDCWKGEFGRPNRPASCDSVMTMTGSMGRSESRSVYPVGRPGTDEDGGEDLGVGTSEVHRVVLKKRRTRHHRRTPVVSGTFRTSQSWE